MRLSQLRKLVEQLSTGGAGGPLPDLQASFTPDFSEVPGFNVGTGLFTTDNTSLAIRASVPELVEDKGYFLAVAHKVDDSDSAVFVTLSNMTGDFSINGDTLLGESSLFRFTQIYMPPHMEITFAIWGAGAHFASPEIYPVKT